MSDYTKLIAVTNRHLCAGDYLTQLEKVCAAHPAALILREKDLPPRRGAAPAAKPDKPVDLTDLRSMLKKR